MFQVVNSEFNSEFTYGNLTSFIYCFLQFKEFQLYWGAVFFPTRRGVLENSFF